MTEPFIDIREKIFNQHSTSLHDLFPLKTYLSITFSACWRNVLYLIALIIFPVGLFLIGVSIWHFELTTTDTTQKIMDTGYYLIILCMIISVLLYFKRKNPKNIRNLILQKSQNHEAIKDLYKVIDDMFLGKIQFSIKNEIGSSKVAATIFQTELRYFLSITNWITGILVFNYADVCNALLIDDWKSKDRKVESALSSMNEKGLLFCNHDELELLKEHFILNERRSRKKPVISSCFKIFQDRIYLLNKHPEIIKPEELVNKFINELPDYKLNNRDRIRQTISLNYKSLKDIKGLKY